MYKYNTCSKRINCNFSYDAHIYNCGAYTTLSYLCPTYHFPTCIGQDYKCTFVDHNVVMIELHRKLCGIFCLTYRYRWNIIASSA